MRLSLGRTLAAASLLLLAACSSNSSKIVVPELSLVQVAMTSADIFNQQFLVRLRVENPNEQELPITKIEYELFLEGDSFAEGTSTRPFVVPAQGEADFDMTVRSHFVSSLGRLVTRLNGRTQVSYVFEGTASSNLSGAKKIPFQESGTVELKYMK